jgi:hypothetical protein
MGRTCRFRLHTLHYYTDGVKPMLAGLRDRFTEEFWRTGHSRRYDVEITDYH